MGGDLCSASRLVAAKTKDGHRLADAANRHTIIADPRCVSRDRNLVPVLRLLKA